VLLKPSFAPIRKLDIVGQKKAQLEVSASESSDARMMMMMMMMMIMMCRRFMVCVKKRSLQNEP